MLFRSAAVVSHYDFGVRATAAARRAQFTAQEPEDIFAGLAEDDVGARFSAVVVQASKKFAAEFPPLAQRTVATTLRVPRRPLLIQNKTPSRVVPRRAATHGPASILARRRATPGPRAPRPTETAGPRAPAHDVNRRRSNATASFEAAAAREAVEKTAAVAAREAIRQKREDDLKRQDFKLEETAATVEREALLAARKVLAVPDDEYFGDATALADPATAQAVADTLKARTDALRAERDRRLPAPSVRAPKRPPVAPLRPLDDKAATARTDAAAADALARERLARAAEALVVDAAVGDEAERGRIVAALQEKLLSTTSEKSAKQRE